MISIKLDFEGDVRRVSLDQLSFQDFKRLIESLFFGCPGNYKIVYTDDEGDKVSISTDLELEEALRQANASSHPLRVKIIQSNDDFQMRQSDPMLHCSGELSAEKDIEKGDSKPAVLTEPEQHDLISQEAPIKDQVQASVQNLSASNNSVPPAVPANSTLDQETEAARAVEEASELLLEADSRPLPSFFSSSLTELKTTFAKLVEIYNSTSSAIKRNILLPLIMEVSKGIKMLVHSLEDITRALQPLKNFNDKVLVPVKDAMFEKAGNLRDEFLKLSEIIIKHLLELKTQFKKETRNLRKRFTSSDESIELSEVTVPETFSEVLPVAVPYIPIASNDVLSTTPVEPSPQSSYDLEDFEVVLAHQDEVGISPQEENTLATLSDMGLNDRNKNLLLLRKHNGDLSSVIFEIFEN